MDFIEAAREGYSDEGEPPVAWERYLEIAPAVLGLPPADREETLAARHLDGAAWARAEQYWMLTFALDLSSGRSDRVDAYGKACADGRKRPAPLRSTGTATTAIAGTATPTVTAATTPAVAGTTTAAVAGTMLDVGAAMREPALPFGPARSPGFTAQVVSSPAAARPAPRNRPDATIDALDVPRAGGALPFAGGAGPSARVPSLTVAQHARLSAELAASPDEARRAELLARYGIDGPGTLIRLGAEWQSRLSMDAALAAEWRAEYGRHRAALQGQSPKR
jgi:hypothetical protein